MDEIVEEAYRDFQWEEEERERREKEFFDYEEYMKMKLDYERAYPGQVWPPKEDEY